MSEQPEVIELGSGASIGKSQTYVSDPSEIPDGYDQQEGPRGGIYYETDAGEVNSGEVSDREPNTENTENNQRSNGGYETVAWNEEPSREQIATEAERVHKVSDDPISNVWSEFITSSFMEGADFGDVRDVLDDLDGFYSPSTTIAVGLSHALNEHASPESNIYEGSIFTGSVDDMFEIDFINSFSDTEGRESYTNVLDGAARPWSNYGGMMSSKSAPLWKAAWSEYSNKFVSKNKDEIENQSVTSEEIDDIKKYSDRVSDAFRDAFGETVPAFRGVNAKNRDELEKARERAEDGDNIELKQMTLSSWTTDPTAAQTFGRGRKAIIVRRDIPVDDIWFSSETIGSMYDDETELVVGNDDQYAHYDSDDVFTPDEFDAAEQSRWFRKKLIRQGAIEGRPSVTPTFPVKSDESGESSDEVVPRFDLSPATNWLRETFGEPERDENESGDTKSTVLDGIEGLFKEGQWRRYEGPRGGEGYQNVSNPDDIRYGLDEAPGEVVGDENADSQSDSQPHEFETHVTDSEGVGWSDTLGGTPFGSIGEIPRGTTVRVDGDNHPDAPDAEGTLEGKVVGYSEGDADRGQFNGLEVETNDGTYSLVVLPEELKGIDTANQSYHLTPYLNDPYPHAESIQGSRKAGIRGGNTTGANMEILDMPNGNRLFSTPIEAYDHAGTPVVSDAEEAKEHNIESPKLINVLGGSACRTRLIDGPDGKYIAKEGIDGRTLSDFQLDNDVDLYTDENTELLNNAAKTYACGYFVGNKDLHGGNVMVNEEQQTCTIIDHDSAGPRSTTTGNIKWPSVMSIAIHSPIQVGKVKNEIAKIGHRYMNGEFDPSKYVDDTYTKNFKRALIEAQKDDGFWDGERGNVSEYPDEYRPEADESHKELREGDEVAWRDPESGMVRHGNISEVYENSDKRWYGQTDDNYEIAIEDLKNVLWVNR